MRFRRGAGRGRVADRRGMGVPAVGGGLGLVGLIVVLLFNALGGSGGGGVTPGAVDSGTADDEVESFTELVLGDVEETWRAHLGDRYEETTVVLFTQATSTGCGVGQTGTGPFYCPADRTIYVDPTFFDALASRFGAPGDFAQAYVIAHEVGHHVQTLLGAGPSGVALELQADCYAGVWGHDAAADGVLEAGDLEEGLDAAAAIGDDRLQEQAGREVNPESFTHGSSAQRVEWFRRGFETGDPTQCDTFG